MSYTAGLFSYGEGAVVIPPKPLAKTGWQPDLTTKKFLAWVLPGGGVGPKVAHAAVSLYVKVFEFEVKGNLNERQIQRWQLYHFG